MKTHGENDSVLYMLLVAFLRGAIKGLLLSGAFFAARDYLEHRRSDRGELF
jgi:hypothetical protein